MQAYPSSVPPPSSDKRWKLVEGTIRRHGHKAAALIEVLHTVQESFGFLDEVSLRFVASSLRLPLSRVYGVATFYHYFSLKPPGEHTCVICMGTGCYVKGAENLMKVIEEIASVKAGETTSDGKVSVVAARCIGSCSLAPAVVFDGEVIPKAQPDAVRDQLRRWLDHDAG
ncbi:MAG: bidirectional hydrogenase complex protein HoxE [Terracidiphilus sp.]|jgi:bidirectional [NiFe] hydrogenase diaphorase subunit